MASYQNQNGQPYSQNQPNPYASQATYSNNSLRRRPSFDNGDDAQFFDQQQAQPPQEGEYAAYGARNNLGSQHGAARVAQNAALPYRTASHNVPLTGYQHQQQATPAYGGYNPAAYQQPNAQYTQVQSPGIPQQQSYGSPTASYPSSGYQPYVPAAYHDTNVQRQPSAYANTTYYQQNVQSPQSAYPHAQPPAPIRRTSDYAYGQQQQQPGSYGAYQHEGHYQPTYSSQQSTYSPPPPVPPPHEGQATSRPYSHSPAFTQHDSYYSQSSQVSQHRHPSPSTSQGLDRRESSSANRSSYQSSSFPTSPQPPFQPSPGAQTSPRRTETLRHPTERPLPGPPSESESDTDYFGARNSGRPQAQGDLVYDDLMKEVNAAIVQGQAGRVSSNQRLDESTPLFSASSPKPLVIPDEVPTHINGNIATSGDHHINYGAFSDDSDAEAAAGLAALQAAEEQDAAEEARRRSGSASLFNTHASQRQSFAQNSSNQDLSSDSDYANIDMGLVGGGYEANMHYGESLQSNYAAAAAAMPSSEYYDRLNPRMDSVRSGVSSEGRESQTSGYETIPTFDTIHPFPPFRTDVARVDTGGTGGLTEPSPHPRRMSFEDGDEANLLDHDYSHPSGSVSPSRDSYQDLFYHPGLSPQRPLPPPPSNSDPGTRNPHLIPAGTYTTQNRYSQYDQSTRPYSAAMDSYQQTLLSPAAVPRSTSLSSSRSVPRSDQPARSKTDADRAKLLRSQGRPVSAMADVYEGSVSSPLDLPTIPRKKFNPSKIPAEQFKRCSEPWALSSVLSWIKDLAEDETDLKEQAISESLVNLFTNKVPTMNTADAETLGEKVIKEMLKAGALTKDEEWVKFGPGTMTGVLFQLTGTGCYSPKLHLNRTKGRCYSHYCMRTLKKADLSLPVEAMKKTEDWQTFYKLKKEDLEGHDSREIKRQNILHEVVTSEDSYISHLDILRTLYRDQLANSPVEIIPAKKRANFIKEVFGQVDQVKKINEDFLLAQLKYRQTEQGPWIVGFSAIFREWIRRARTAYIEYAANYPRADYLMRREIERNLLFKQFVDQARDDKRSNRLAWDTYLKDPITRLQRYSLLLMTVEKEMPKQTEEKTNLQFAIDEVRAATFECNSKLAEMEKKMELIELGNKIRLRKGMEKEVELNLDHLGREILIRGDLQRAGGKGFQWVDTHAILFDHYLVLAKTVVNRDSSGGRKYDIYDVSKVPIPMDLIVLESTSDDPVVKSSVKGIGAVTTSVSTRGPLASDPRLNRTTSTTSGPGTLMHTNTSTSLGSSGAGSGNRMIPSTVLESSSSKDEKIMYPFRLKHLGKTETYTLYAPSAANRQEWCEAIITAKTRHAASLFAQNAEPFRLRVLADTAFAYDSMSISPRRIVIRDTPLDRAIREAEQSYAGQTRPSPVCRSAVNCATVFNQPYGRLMCAVGTDFGVFISEYQNPRGWTRAITLSKVTQVAVFEEFNLFLLIADKALIAYHLDVVCPPSGSAVPQNDASSRKAPQKLSGTKDVGFFATGKMKDRALVFYKKRDGLTSTFKVLEPVLQKSTATRTRFLPSAARRGQTEFFREYDEFYIPAECYGINLYQSSLAISTARGVEVLTLDKKQPWSVPNLRSDQSEAQAHLSSIASRIKDLKPLGMFRLGEAEFLVAFEECAVYVNKHGDVSRGVVMEFVGRAKSACLHGQYLILFDDDFVEIRDSMNGRLKQVIAGKDIKMLDDGGGGNGGANAQHTVGLGGGLNGLGLQGFGAAPRTVKICMQHPEYERSHILVELLENTEPQG